jgi:hypothetical protein
VLRRESRSVSTFKVMNEIETHPFKPYVPRNATVLIIGSFPGRDMTQKNQTIVIGFTEQSATSFGKSFPAFTK